MNTVDENRTSPLHIACSQGGLQTVEELLNHGADIKLTDCAGWTALHVATWYQRAHIVYILLRHNADMSLCNSNEETPWDLCRDKETSEVYETF